MVIVIKAPLPAASYGLPPLFCNRCNLKFTFFLFLDTNKPCLLFGQASQTGKKEYLHWRTSDCGNTVACRVHFWQMFYCVKFKLTFFRSSREFQSNITGGWPKGSKVKSKHPSETHRLLDSKTLYMDTLASAKTNAVMLNVYLLTDASLTNK